MPGHPESDAESFSEASQKFVPQEDDEETLWEVIRITGERNDTYKVQWKGVDPKTQKPWPQSWVKKSDCTDDLVFEWKRLKKEKAKGSKRGKSSAASKKSGRASTTSTVVKGSHSKQPVSSTSKLTRRSTSTTTSTALGDVTASRLSRTREATRSTATATPTGRRMSPNDAIEEEDELDELDSESDDEPRKGKQRNGGTSNKASLVNAKKRKLVDANSAPTSANLKSHKAGDADEGGNPLEKSSTTRPTKKRKVEVEVVKFDSEEEVESRKSPTQSPSRTGSQQQLGATQESYPLQTVRGKVAAPEEEDDEDDQEEERMVEDALSQPASPRPEFVENADDDDFYAPYDTVDIPDAQDPNEDLEENVEQIIIPTKSKTTTKPSTTKKKAKSTNVASSSPSLHSSSLPVPMVPVKIGPPAQKRPTAKSNTKPALIQKPHFGHSHLTSPEPSQHSFRSGSLPSLQYPVSQDDLPGPSHNVVLPPAPTKEHSVFYNEKHDEHVAILSPKALRRLEQFDEEVMGVKKGKQKAIDRQEEEEDTESEVEIVAERLTKKPGPLFIPDPSSPLDRTPTASPMLSSNDVHARSEEPTTIQRKNHATDDDIRSTTSKKTNDHPKPTDTTPNSAPEPPTHSYENDIVPETDESQSQELKPPTAAGPSTPKNSTTLTRQGSLKSRMKPRTQTPSSPFAANSNILKKDRPLRPIPMLSPSTFHPLLSIPELDSSLPDSIIEPAEQSGDAEDLEAPMSSIEEFDSPVKDQRKRPTLVLKGKGRARSKSTASNVSGRESASEIWDSQVVQRGQAIAEAAKKKTRLDVPSRPKRTVEEIQAAASKSRQGSTAAEADEDEDMADLSTVPVPPASGPPVIDEESITVQEMEATYIDLSGGSGEPPIDPVQLRQEEEESTQDLMLELAQVQEQQRGMDSIDLEGGWATGPPAASSKDSEQGSSRGGRLEVIPEIMVVNPSRAASARPYSPELTPAPDPRARLRSRSRSKTPAPAPAAVVHHQKRSRQNSKSDLGPPAARRSATPSLRPPQDGSSLNNDVHPPVSEPAPPAPETKPQEVAAPEAQSLLERTTHVDAVHTATEEKGSTHNAEVDEVKQQLADANTQWASEKAAWETERAQLLAQVESANKRKVDAENEREFFREQYARASGFVTSVRDENQELEKRIKIAEEQAQNGVALVKATFELRVKALQEDAKSWRKMAEFLIEKDQRTDNDEIRRRAAEEPELRARCERQEGALEAHEDRIEELELKLMSKESNLGLAEFEAGKWQEESTQLRVKLNEALTKLERIGRAGAGDDSMDGSADGHEFVYLCKWRPDNGDESKACREVFVTISELEQHLVSAGGHLQT